MRSVIITLCLLLSASMIEPGCERLRERRLVSIADNGPISGPLGIDIDNRLGTVRVEVVNDLAAPVIWAGCSGDTETERTPDYVTAALVTQHGRSTLRVLSTTVSGSVTPKPVNIRIKVPACDGIRVRNSGGSVWLKGVSGAIDVMNDAPGLSGGTTVVVAKPAHDSIKIHVKSGGIDLRVPDGSCGILSATAQSGALSVDLAKTQSRDVVANGSRYSAKLGDCANEITLTAEKGDLQFLFARR